MPPSFSWRPSSRSRGGRAAFAASGGAPRTLDLDLVSFGDLVVDLPGLTLPHPGAMQRPFVLAPLCEVEPAWVHPVTGEGACAALGRFESGGVIRTELGWDSV